MIVRALRNVAPFARGDVGPLPDTDHHRMLAAAGGWFEVLAVDPAEAPAPPEMVVDSSSVVAVDATASVDPTDATGDTDATAVEEEKPRRRKGGE
jgi:hypothetical protein